MKAAPNALATTRDTLDLATDPGSIMARLNDIIAEFESAGGTVSGVINAAAYTAVDKAETEADVAMRVNGDAPGTIAQVARDRNLPFVHISTDYVFNGLGKRPYHPDFETDPVNTYGRTKLAGERSIRAEMQNVPHPSWSILRTSWVYDTSNSNFLMTMLRLSKTNDVLKVVDDQIGRPTHTTDLADAAFSALRGITSDPMLSGLYHVSNSGDPISWAGFACEIFRLSARNTKVVPIPTRDYPTAAARPAYSVMAIEPFESAFGLNLPTWRKRLALALSTS
jgi:dTDP-4-dehydrorhamnose reductase